MTWPCRAEGTQGRKGQMPAQNTREERKEGEQRGVSNAWLNLKFLIISSPMLWTPPPPPHTPNPPYFGWEGPSCSFCTNSVRLQLGPPGRVGLIGEKAWEQIGLEKAHSIHILTNIWDRCWRWKWGTCEWSWAHVAEVTIVLKMWQERKSRRGRTEDVLRKQSTVQGAAAALWADQKIKCTAKED